MNRAAPTAARAVVVAALLLGAFFRFYNIDAHGFWGDEKITALRVAGHTAAGVIAAASRRAVEARRIDAFSRLDSRSSATGVVHSLAAEDSHHPPLYYILAYFWESAAGSGVTQLRLFSAIVGLFLIPAIGWLAFELSRSRFVGAAAAAVAAISPFNIEYAQQAREYGLWAVLICVSSAALVRVLRTGSDRWWVGYGVAMAASLYTCTFTLVVVCGHLLYVGVIGKTVPRRELYRFAIALGAALLVFVPWLYVIAHQYVHVSGYGTAGYARQTVKGAIYAWAIALTAPFFDLEFVSARYLILVAALLGFEAIACAWVARNAPFRQWWFLAALGGSTILLQLGNTGLTDMPRYLTPAILALQISIAWWLAARMRLPDRQSRRALAVGAFAAFACIAIANDVVRARTPVWWTNVYGQPLSPLAQRIDTVPHPLVLADSSYDWEVAYDESGLLRGDDLITYYARPGVIRARLAGAQPVFVLTRYPALARRIAGSFALEAVTVGVAPTGYALLARPHHGRIPMRWLWRFVHPKT